VLTQAEPDQNTERLIWTAIHRCLSVGVCSNIADYDIPNCVVNGDLDALLDAFIQYLRSIQQKASKRSLIITQLEAQIKDLKPMVTKGRQKLAS
jgi:hypothetical protein